MGTPVLVALYVPGDRPERFAKAFAAGADQVILDLEDAVAPGHKELAREAVAALLAGPVPGRLAVRPNGPGTPWHDEDLAMLAAAASPPALRLPKVEGPGDVDRVLDRLRTGVAGRDPVDVGWSLATTRAALEHRAVLAGGATLASGVAGGGATAAPAAR